jgi:chorismate dehydratase
MSLSADEPLPKLRLASFDTPEQLTLRAEREQRALALQREANLDNSLAPFRVGSVPYLNTLPLTRGLESQIIYAHPSELAARLRRNELDAALVSITEVLYHDEYDVLDGIAIASLGEVKSVFLAHRQPLEALEEVYCDPASLTGACLVKVLLAERGCRPQFKPLAGYEPATMPDAVLLIGNQALDFLLGSPVHEIWDLGAAWFELTGLPFVYAVWALRRGVDNLRLRRQLREAKDFGLDTLDAIISSHPAYTYDFRKDYLGWHIHYHLGTDEKRGLARFVDMINDLGLGPAGKPHFVV